MLSIIGPALICGFIGARRKMWVWLMVSWLMTIVIFAAVTYLSVTANGSAAITAGKFSGALLGQSLFWLLIGVPIFLLVRWLIIRNDEGDAQ